ncbi:sigma 54 modulation/S30EA ribosomal C-terminal domain-containing protein [Nocardia asteroides]|uniref:sigma 54 modulation/S30EA ribosomal C-terminal domain-containing protein n=1 Tax=Nocardia asteroides TaxID=1824 RepID=UPI0037AEB0BA
MSTAELRWAGPEIAVVTSGVVDAGEVARTARAVGSVLGRGRAGEPVRIRLSNLADSGVLLAQVNVRRQRGAIRVQVPGPVGFVAAMVSERLERQLARMMSADAAARVWPDPARPPLAEVTEERPIVRHKLCAVRRTDPATAARMMDARDYDAHLFVDAETGEDAVVYWAGPLGVRLTRQTDIRPATGLACTMNPHPAPRLTASEAAARLCRFGLPHLFFTDPATTRGALLYRRYDGDLALVRPVAGR